jgi:glyoxylase-like metal-dependent hydrolase (beta-lactamase superfamily II)
VKLGQFQLDIVSDGRFWLDGGAMFGVVPRVLWEKRAAPDEKNRICLALNCLLVRTGRRNLLLDTGCGAKYSEKETRMYRIERETTLLGQLQNLGLQPSDIDMVINTHLHFDHCGGNTRASDGGEIVPTFPNAQYVVRRDEFEDANQPNERTAASYFPHNWRPVEQAGRLRLIDADTEVAPGVRLIHTPGHTRGHQSVLIQSEGKALLYLADLCPTSAHVSLPWVMGYDLYPLTTMETKRRIFAQALEESWLLVFEHDPATPLGRLGQADGKYYLDPVPWEA